MSQISRPLSLKASDRWVLLRCGVILGEAVVGKDGNLVERRGAKLSLFGEMTDEAINALDVPGVS